MVELHPDLAPHVYDFGGLKFIKTPFVNTLYDESMHAMYNKIHEQQSGRFHSLVEKGRFADAMNFVDSPFRVVMIQKLLNEDNQFTKDTPEYWDMLFYAYRKAERCSEDKEVWLSLMDGARDNQDTSMRPNDRAVLDALPEKFKVYRGGKEDLNELGISFSLSPKDAMWFAKRFGEEEESVVIEAEVHKDDVIVYSNSRGEHEIIIDPEDVRVLDKHFVCGVEELDVDFETKMIMDIADNTVAMEEPSQQSKASLKNSVKL